MELIIPLLLIALFIFALFRKVNPYEAFAEGASEAVPIILKILPYLGAMLMAIAVFRKSGGMDMLVSVFSPLFKFLGIPVELCALTILRPFSGSASLALLKDILTQYGTDSFIGRAASISVGSTETIFYTIALYCGSVGIKKTRHALPVALLSGLIGTISAVFLAIFF